MSQDELAKKLGYKSRSSINKIELGKSDITQHKVVAFANALQTTPAYLMGWDDAAEPENKKNDAITDIILRLRRDDELLALITKICNLSSDQLNAVRAVLNAISPD